MVKEFCGMKIDEVYPFSSNGSVVSGNHLKINLCNEVAPACPESTHPNCAFSEECKPVWECIPITKLLQSIFTPSNCQRLPSFQAELNVTNVPPQTRPEPDTGLNEASPGTPSRGTSNQDGRVRQSLGQPNPVMSSTTPQKVQDAPQNDSAERGTITNYGSQFRNDAPLVVQQKANCEALCEGTAGRDSVEYNGSDRTDGVSKIKTPQGETRNLQGGSSIGLNSLSSAGSLISGTQEASLSSTDPVSLSDLNKPVKERPTANILKKRRSRKKCKDEPLKTRSSSVDEVNRKFENPKQNAKPNDGKYKKSNHEIQRQIKDKSNKLTKIAAPVQRQNKADGDTTTPRIFDSQLSFAADLHSSRVSSQQDSSDKSRESAKLPATQADLISVPRAQEGLEKERHPNSTNVPKSIDHGGDTNEKDAIKRTDPKIHLEGAQQPTSGTLLSQFQRSRGSSTKRRNKINPTKRHKKHAPIRYLRKHLHKKTEGSKYSTTSPMAKSFTPT